MKLRSLTELEDCVDAETAWRKRELTDLVFNVRGARDSKMQTSLRAGLALLYAHWEGWIKAVARLYVDYVGQQKPKLGDLSAPFLGNALRVELDRVGHANSAKVHTDFASLFVSDWAACRAVVNLEFIRSEGNLTSKVLRDITTRIGIDYAPYALLETLIDERLVHQRNCVAHGDFLSVDVAAYEDLHQKVLQMLNDFTQDVLAAARSRAYLRRPPTNALP